MPRPANPTLREAILRAVLRLVEQKGPGGLTMREVAAALGYSATAIYQHFASKEALLLTLKVQAGDLLAEEMAAASHAPTLEEQLHVMAHRYMAFGLQHPAYYRLIFQDTVSDLPLSPEYQARMRRAWSFMRETLAAWLEAHGVPDMIVDHEANVVWAMVHGFTSLALAHRLPGSDQDALHTLLDLALGHWANGVLSGAASPFPARPWAAPSHVRARDAQEVEEVG